MCSGLIGYEVETHGDGLNTFYYNNENFQGTPVLDVSNNIDLQLNNESPIEGVSFENFSIKWKGWINIKRTSSYKFFMICDDGCELKINN